MLLKNIFLNICIISEKIARVHGKLGAENQFSNNKIYVTPNRMEQEYWTNESISSNASTSNFPMREEISSGSVSSGSGMTNNCSRIATTLPTGNQALSILQDMSDAGKKSL